MRCRSVAGIAALAAALWPMVSGWAAKSSADAGIPAGLLQPRLALEEVPTVTAPAVGLPAPATWPILRHEQRLRFLAALDLQQPAAAYQRIARRCHAALDLIFTAGSGPKPDEITTLAHTNDQWIEAHDRPWGKEVADRASRMLQETLASAAGRYDVILLDERHVGILVADPLLHSILTPDKFENVERLVQIALHPARLVAGVGAVDVPSGLSVPLEDFGDRLFDPAFAQPGHLQAVIVVDGAISSPPQVCKVTS